MPKWMTSGQKLNNKLLHFTWHWMCDQCFCNKKQWLLISKRLSDLWLYLLSGFKRWGWNTDAWNTLMAPRLTVCKLSWLTKKTHTVQVISFEICESEDHEKWPWVRWCSPHCSPGCTQTHVPLSTSCPSEPPARFWPAAHVCWGQSGRKTSPQRLLSTRERGRGWVSGLGRGNNRIRETTCCL